MEDNRMRIKILAVLTVVFLALAACAPLSPEEEPSVNNPGEQATQAPTPTPADTPTSAPEDPPQFPPAALAAQKALAEKLGVALVQVEITVVEEKDWSDSCLGLGGPAESCAAVITSGYRIGLKTGDSLYEYHTNQDGSLVKLVEDSHAGQPGGEFTAGGAAENAPVLLARIAGLRLKEIRFIGMEAQDWPDSCLGLGGPAESCAAVITPGYQVELEDGGVVYVLRTNADGTDGRLGGPPEQIAALGARQVAAQELNTALETVRLVSVEAVEWPNSCLGIIKKGAACLQVITPGFKVIVEAGGQRLEYHTNRDATSILRAE
jgi:hypothetical protein